MIEKLKVVNCPGCGCEATIKEKEVSNKAEFQCQKCETKFSITFKTDEDRNLRAYRLAEDYE